mmetsp:Transcript_16200/g.56577  ORF Transcript_16200/g.56577 Transcript_16200/m.56577 type:complete len:240 (-) Transcript_16200:1751-2470(-)
MLALHQRHGAEHRRTPQAARRRLGRGSRRLGRQGRRGLLELKVVKPRQHVVHLGPRLPVRVVRHEVDERLFHLALLGAQHLGRVHRRAVVRVAVLVDVEQRIAAHGARALHVRRHAVDEVHQPCSAVRQHEAQEQRREDDAEDVLQEQHDAVLEQVQELVAHVVRVAAATPVPRHVVRERHHLPHHAVGVEHALLGRWDEGARDGQHGAHHRNVPQQVAVAQVDEEQQVLVDHGEQQQR